MFHTLNDKSLLRKRLELINNEKLEELKNMFKNFNSKIKEAEVKRKQKEAEEQTKK
jgi:uncharacterized membrane protein (DUF106 family)